MKLTEEYMLCIGDFLQGREVSVEYLRESVRYLHFLCYSMESKVMLINSITNLPEDDCGKLNEIADSLPNVVIFE